MSLFRWTQLFKLSISLNILHSIAVVLNKQKYGKLVDAEFATIIKTFCLHQSEKYECTPEKSYI